MIDDIEKAARLRNGRATFVSLVKRPANRKRLIVKSDGSYEGYSDKIRKDALRGLLYVTIYEPNVVDSRDDMMEKADLESLAHQFLLDGFQDNIDYEHSYKKGMGTTVESFILRGSDPMFPDSRPGSWCAAIQLAKAAMPYIDVINGVSWAGGAIREQKSDDIEPIARFSKDSTVSRDIPIVRFN